jgi:trimethylamine--corrinoid protein Co-methyltransferase
LSILSKIGIRVDSEKALKILKSRYAEKMGVKLFDQNKVRFQPEVVEWAIQQAPSTIDIFNRKGELIFRAGENETRFGIGVTNLYYQDPITDAIVPFNRSLLRLSVGLGNCLSAYDVISTPGILHDIHPEKADLYTVLEMLAGSTKPLIILISDEKQFSPGLNLLEQLAGPLVEKPFVVPYFNPVTPLIINQSTGNNMLAAIERGLPIIFSNYGMAGVSTPITAAGILALLNAELLTGLVLSQLAKPGTPVILGSLPAYFDMKLMLDFFDPQTMLLNLACAEMMAHYGLPHAGTSGSVDGWGPDLVSSQNLVMNHLTSLLGKVGLAPFVGGCYGSKVFSPTLVVFSHEIIEQARHFSKGVEISDDLIAMNELARIGIGGNFVASPITMKLFRKAYYSSQIFPRLSLEKWQESGCPDSMKYLREKTTELLNQNNYPADQAELLKRGEFLISKFLG